MSSLFKQRVRFGPFVADLATEELWKGGIRLKLGGQPFGILAMLLQRPGELVTREALRAKLWSTDTFVDFNHGLNAAMNKLRECLNDSPSDPKYIETLPRRGYRFIGLVEELAPSDAAPVERATIASSASVEAAEPQPPELQINWAESAPSARVSVPYRWIAMLCLVAVATVVTLILIGRHGEGASSELDAAMTLGVVMPAGDPSFSPQGDQIAFRSFEGPSGQAGIYVSRLNDGKQIQLTESPEDCCPTWSPDGRAIAFTRTSGAIQTIYEVASAGGPPRVLRSAHHNYGHGETDWSPDGQTIAFSGNSPNGGAQIFALSVHALDVRPLTEPQIGEMDWGPAYSPDGGKMAFVRARTDTGAEDLFVADSDGKNVHRLTYANARIISPPTWTADSKTIVYASNQGDETRLWRIPASGGGAEVVAEAGVLSWHPSISRAGNHLVYQHQQTLGTSSIWQLDVTHPEARGARKLVVSSTGRNEGPQISPNGKKLAFMSDRSGSMEIWISDADGSYPLNLTALGGCGSPRWSPDSQSIAFDSVHSGRAAIYVAGMNGGKPRALVEDDAENTVPGWSHDGQSIYFASTRSGQDEVWKIPADGGQAVQLTHNGGFAPRESSDGKFIYYAKHRGAHPQIWQVAVGGGPETLLSPLIRPAMWASMAVTEKGIYFLDDTIERLPMVEYYDFATRQVQTLFPLSGDSFWLNASADGKALWYEQDLREETTIMVRKNFH